MRKKVQDSIYNAKILLFGEYTVIFESKALTIPYTYFTGKWSFMGSNKYTRLDKAVKSNRDLHRFLQYLKNSSPIEKNCNLDLDRFRDDLENGLFFESNIPQGYGVGSSGALVAAFYNDYCPDPVVADKSYSLQKLKEMFSLLESYFHGTSSGMDPLNCYVGEPLLFEGKKSAHIVEVPPQTSSKDGAIFLINSGYPSATEPLVKLFLSKVKDEKFRKSVNETLIPLTNSSIDNIISCNLDNLFIDIRDISEYQLFNFKEMIPGKFMELWKQGLDSGEFYLKLCGSGGGGFLLGFTRDYSIAEKLVAEAGIDIIPVYKNSFFRK